MKWKTTITLLISSLFFLSCAHTFAPKKNPRTPASVQAPTAWGKAVNSDHQELLDDVENAPSGVYKGAKVPN
jgi:hypothetical protein